MSPLETPLTPGQAQHLVSLVLLTKRGDVVAAVYKSLHTALPLADEACPVLAGKPHRNIAHAILTTLPQTLVCVLTRCGRPGTGVSLSHQESIGPRSR